jgi:hypothetical protein
VWFQSMSLLMCGRKVCLLWSVVAQYASLMYGCKVCLLWCAVAKHSSFDVLLNIYYLSP